MHAALTADLNERQLEAVTHGDGPLLVFAGAGTGKTRVLTRRIAYLIGARGVSPAAVLAVTFTNKAAGEMRERVESLLGRRGEGMWIGTFHATCARLLRIDGEAIGVPRDFSIYDDGDQMSIMKEVGQALRLDEGADPSFKPRSLLAEVSRAKNELLSPSEYARTAADERERRVADAFANYELALSRAHALDFDDLIGRAVQLLRDVPEVRAKYQARFRHVLVDEYQDINYAQYLWVRTLAEDHQNLAVVGDDDQSIYRWRGADVRLMLQFEKDFPGAHVVKLEQNYRSTQTVLDAAYHVIRKNAHRAEKRLFSDLGRGEKITIYCALSEREEAAWAADTVRRESQGGVSLGRQAVLFRTNAQSRALEEAFRDEGLPYQLVGGQRFYDRKEIRDVLAYLRVIANPFDSVSLLRIINTPARGIGDRAVERLHAEAARAEAPLLAVVLRAGDLTEELGRSAAPIAKFGSMLQQLIGHAETLPTNELIREVLAASRYEATLAAERSAEAQGRLENVRELVTAAETFAEKSEDTRLPAFLEHVALVSDVDGMAGGDQAVTLMTLHAAKGLEFDTVYIVGLEESILPHIRSVLEDPAVEEERRLCYVGITRAQRRLYLSHARERSQFGETRRNLPSRFLLDVPGELVREQGGNRALGRTVDEELAALQARMGGQMTLDLSAALSRHRQPTTAAPTAPKAPVTPERKAQAAVEPCPFAPGDKVSHKQFGAGLVVSVQRGDTVTVAFRDGGVRKLLLEYANLRRA
jgi:DNA helicase-2/ATP-dependent DNA helicase PcrA